MNLFCINIETMKTYLKELTGTELKAFILIKCLHDEEGGPIRINYDEFQEGLGMSRGTIANTIKSLLEKEYIERKDSQGSFLYSPAVRKDPEMVALEAKFKTG